MLLSWQAKARGATHVELPFVEVVQCKSYTLTPSSRESVREKEREGDRGDREFIKLPALFDGNPNGPILVFCITSTMCVTPTM